MSSASRLRARGAVGVLMASLALAIGAVVGPSTAASTQVLTIAVTGLPAGAAETLTVVGGDAFKTAVKVHGTGQSQLVKVRLPAGNYTVDARDATSGQQRYFPTAYVTTVHEPSTQQVQLRFRKLVLTFSGLGKLRLDMTVARARSADPSITVQGTAGCVSARSRDGDLLFNPDGRLSYISAASYVGTAKGITKGSTYAQVAAAYTVTNPVLTTEDDQPMWIGADGRQEDPGSAPAIGLRFKGGRAVPGTDEVDVSQGGVVSQLVLDGGQRCFD